MFDNMFKNKEEDNNIKSKFDVETRVLKYQDKFLGTLAEDTHTPFTFLIGDKTRRRLDSLHHKLNIENGKPEVDKHTFKTGRKLLRGYKYKFINTAINYFLDMYEKEEGKIGDIKSITYKVTDTTNNKMYIVGYGNDKYEVYIHNHKAEEIGYYKELNKKEVDGMVAEVEGKRVRVGRATKK